MLGYWNIYWKYIDVYFLKPTEECIACILVGVQHQIADTFLRPETDQADFGFCLLALASGSGCFFLIMQVAVDVARTNRVVVQNKLDTSMKKFNLGS